MTSRKNPAVPHSDARSSAEEKIIREYRSKHWGLDPEVMIEVDDRDVGFPGVTHVVQMGSLVSLELKPLKGAPRAMQLTLLDFGQEARRPNVAQRPHLAFDMSKAQRLFLLLPKSLQAQVRKLVPKNAHYYLLGDLAKRVGGRQSRYPYPSVEVTPIGTVDYISYLTEKRETPSTKGQGGLAQFRHEFGEEPGGIKPLLVADRQGRLFLAGGSWSIPAGGIRN